VRRPRKETAAFEEESFGGKALRGAARTATDIVQTGLGAPGDTLSLIHEGAFGVPGTGDLAEKISGEKKVPYSKTHPSKILPTSEMLEKERPDYLKPQTSGEASFSEFVQDVTAMAIPLPGRKVKVLSKLATNLKRLGKRVSASTGVVAAGEVAKGSAEEFGASPDTANYIKMGTVVLGSLGTGAGIKGADKFKNSLYEEANALKPKGASMRGLNLYNKALALKKRLESGGASPASAGALEKVNEILASIKKNKGKISIDELEDFGKKINVQREALYTDFQGKKGGRKMAKANLDETSSLVKGALKEYGKTNPKWYAKWSEAQDVHAAIEGSKRISYFMEKNLKTIGKYSIGPVVIGAITNPAAAIPTIGASLVGYGILKGSELTARFMKSKSLRKYYLNILDGAARKDATFMNHNLAKLEKEIEDNPSLLESSEED
jgi:hypothetical protein